MFIFRFKKIIFFWLSPLLRPHLRSDFASKFLKKISKGLQLHPIAYLTPGYASGSMNVSF